MPRTAVIPVKVLKKIKARDRWILCQAVPEPNGRYNDRVRVEGKIEVHPEGHYYLEWREGGQRRREAISSRSQVLDRVRIKTLELGAASAGMSLTPALAADSKSVSAPASFTSADGVAAVAQHILSGLGLYLQQLAGGTFANSGPAIPPIQLPLAMASAGLMPPPPTVAEPTPSHSAMSTIECPRSVVSPTPELGLPSPFVAKPLPAAPTPKDRMTEDVEHAPGEPAFSHVPVKEAELAPSASVDGPKESLTIAGTIASFLKDVEPPQREWKTYEEYRNVLHYFRDQCKKVYVRDVVRDDCLEFMRYLYSIGNEERTVYNRIGIVLHWLRLNGVKDILDKRDKPNYVEGRREMYQPDDLEALFRVCAPDEKVRYLFFLLTGERDKEVRYTTWADIDFRQRCVWVTAKKHLKFKPKDKEERKIPVPASLLETLRAYKERQTGTNPHDLLFPTSEGKPDKKFENKLKRLAHRNGLSCGHCVSKYGNKCSEGPYCGKWFLHKFRHTFATNQLEEGVSIRTLQEWLGHSDLESTMVYLKYVDSKQIHEIVDNTAIARLAAGPTGSEATLNVAQ